MKNKGYAKFWGQIRWIMENVFSLGRFRKYGPWFWAGHSPTTSNFYSFVFIHKISTRVVCVNGKHPNIAYFSSFPGVGLLPFARVMHSSHDAFHYSFFMNDLAILMGGSSTIEQYHRISAIPPVCISAVCRFSYSVSNRIYRLGCLLFILRYMQFLIKKDLMHISPSKLTFPICICLELPKLGSAKSRVLFCYF